MGIVEKARQIEATLSRTMDRAADRAAQTLGTGSAREPLEIVGAIVDVVERRVEPAGRGAHVFPFNRITVSILAATADTRARYEAVLAVAPSLHTRIHARIHDAGCDVSGIVVTTQFVARKGSRWTEADFHVDFERAALPVVEPAPASGPRDLGLVVVSGTIDVAAHRFRAARVNIGRCAEVRDRLHRLVRLNHVAFADGEENPSVSRQHAHIDYVAATGDYRLCDDHSGHGTSIVRQGATVPVPAGARGVRLYDGDEIVIGDARIRISITS